MIVPSLPERVKRMLGREAPHRPPSPTSTDHEAPAFPAPARIRLRQCDAEFASLDHWQSPFAPQELLRTGVQFRSVQSSCVVVSKHMAGAVAAH